MTEDDRAIDGTGRRRDPPTTNAIVEELVGGRAMVPHGDRVDAAESGGVEHERERVRRGDDHVVRVFVLHDDLGDVPVAYEAVGKHVLECREL